MGLVFGVSIRFSARTSWHSIDKLPAPQPHRLGKGAAGQLGRGFILHEPLMWMAWFAGTRAFVRLAGYAWIAILKDRKHLSLGTLRLTHMEVEFTSCLVF